MRLFCYLGAKKSTAKGGNPMKKLTAIVLTVMLTLSLFACGETPPAEETPFCTSTFSCEQTTSPIKPTTEQTTQTQITETRKNDIVTPTDPTATPMSLADSDFFFADLLDYENLMKTYDGFYVTGHMTAWENSEHIALRLLSYEKLQAFLTKSTMCEAVQVLKTYEESFFEENALMLILFGKSSSTSYGLKKISQHGKNYMIELKYTQPYIVTDDYTYEMLLIPDKKHNIENASVDMLITVSTYENGNASPHSTLTDICPEHMQNSFSRVSYIDAETLFTGYNVKAINTNFDSKKASLIRFDDHESFLAWQTNALKPHEESGNYGSNGTALANASQYDEAFFAENALNIVMFHRSSGSYTHKNATAYLCANGKIIVRLTTNSPEMWTCDMATWLLFLPQDKEIANAEFDRIFADFE